MTRRLALLIVLALLGACGSTVPPSQRGVASGPAESGLDAPSFEEGDPLSDVAGDSGERVSSSGTTRTGGAPRTGTAPRGSSVAFGPGVTADKIFVGLSYAENNNANAALGAGGVSGGEPKAVDLAVIDDINDNGGIGGRKVEPIFHAVNPTSSAPWVVMDQQACDAWTQDNKIFAAIAEPLSDSDTLAGCLHDRGAAFITTQLSTSDAARFQRLPTYIELSMMNLDRSAVALVDGLKAQGWFGGWNSANGTSAQTKAKVGIITYDGATWAHAVDKSMVPALRALGYAPAADDIVRVKKEEGTSDTASTGAAASSAVLRLRGNGVTHVIIFDREGLLTLFFTRSADSQRYRPRYGLTTQNGAQALMDGAALPKEQFIGAKGIGWFPSLDLPQPVSARSEYTNASKKRCLAVLKERNITFSDANAESIAMNTCSSWWFLRDAVKASGGILTRPGFIDGVARLGTSFLAAGNFANRFSATQHDGVGAYRHYAFDQSCACMKYASGDVAAP